MKRYYVSDISFHKLAQVIKDYINKKITGYANLGTASTKDFTTYVSPTQTEQLPISSSVYSAMTNMLRGAYHPAGSKTIAELTSDLLVKANLGNVYKITEDGVTSDLFIGGAGQTIKTGDNAVVLYASEDTYMFSLESGVVDLDAYQKKELTQAVEGANTVEDALVALSDGKVSTDLVPSDASASNKLVTLSRFGAIDTTRYTDSVLKDITINVCKTIRYAGSSDIPSSTDVYCGFINMTQGTDQVTQILYQFNVGKIWTRYRYGTWSSWQKLVTESDLTWHYATVAPDSFVAIPSLYNGFYEACVFDTKTHVSYTGLRLGTDIVLGAIASNYASVSNDAIRLLSNMILCSRETSSEVYIVAYKPIQAVQAV